MVVLIDFGSQTAHLIARRVREFGITVEIVEPEDALSAVKKFKPSGIILSGGPSSVYEKGAPTIDKKIFSLGIPVLDICYGLQLRSHLLGGEVRSGTKEYGPAEVRMIKNESRITKSLPKEFTVWMSHGDSVLSMPKNFKIVGSSKTVKYAFVTDDKNKQYGLQFHPEVEHTENGLVILKNFLDICNLKTKKKVYDLKSMEQQIRDQVGDSYAIGAVSGGVDSTVAAALVANAIGKQFIPIYVENGLMRAGTADQIRKIFKHIGIQADIVECEDEMLKLLRGVDDPEEKRKIIGNFYIEIFEREMKKLVKSGKDVKFLVQGTIYSDVIESKGSKHASKIKSHHNVGGLPEKMKLKVVEPLRELYKDEVREIGKMLGLPKEFVQRQPFPGPGYAIRVRGEVTKERLVRERQADVIVLEELEKAGLMDQVFLSFPIMSGAYSTAVKGDGSFFGEVIALRIIDSRDIMTAKWSELPYSVLQKISSRIVNEVPEVSRVVYDITTKPPATMEWE